LAAIAAAPGIEIGILDLEEEEKEEVAFTGA